MMHEKDGGKAMEIGCLRWRGLGFCAAINNPNGRVVVYGGRGWTEAMTVLMFISQPIILDFFAFVHSSRTPR